MYGNGFESDSRSALCHHPIIAVKLSKKNWSVVDIDQPPGAAKFTCAGSLHMSARMSMALQSRWRNRCQPLATQLRPNRRIGVRILDSGAELGRWRNRRLSTETSSARPVACVVARRWSPAVLVVARRWSPAVLVSTARRRSITAKCIAGA